MATQGRPWWVLPCAEAGPAYRERVDALHEGPAYVCPECGLWHANPGAQQRIQDIEDRGQSLRADRLYYREERHNSVRSVHHYPAVQVKHFSDEGVTLVEMKMNDFLATLEPEQVIRVGDIVFERADPGGFMEAHEFERHYFMATVVYRSVPEPDFDLTYDEAEADWSMGEYRKKYPSRGVFPNFTPVFPHKPTDPGTA